MEIIDIFQKPLQKTSTILALGLFDGVHIGHKALLKETVRIAKEKGVLPAVFTFHQTAYKKAPSLYPREVTYRQMEALGIGRIYEADFSAISSYSPEAFVEEILRGICTPLCVLCGDNFRFGKGAKGNADTLFRLFSKKGEEVKVLPPVELAGETVSSSLVREALKEGKPECARAYLGEAYTLYGRVSHGKALGRTMHFPTINLEIPSDFLVPKRGVYATVAKIGDIFYTSVSNIGRRPTVEQTEVDNCETHLLDASGDFYGQAVEVRLLAYLREEQVFSGKDALMQQIAQDVAHAKEWFAAHKIEGQA